MSGRPDVTHDHPLTCHWQPTDPDAYQSLDLPPAKSRAAANTRDHIITEAFVLGRADETAWISYSRRREFYTDRGRYRPPTYTYARIVPTVDQLAACGLLEHEKAVPGQLGWQSRFKASPELLCRLNATPTAILHDPHELVILRDSDGNSINYRDTDQTDRLRRHLKDINEAILATAMGLKEHIVHPGDPLPAGAAKFGAARSDLHRVFNRSRFTLGGRFYGAWWQNIPKKLRRYITINGRPTIELDFPHLHPTLLYIEAGVRPHGDPYDIPGWDRTLVKISFNTLVNADTRTAAVKSIANEIGGKGSYYKAEHLVQAIEERHRPIAAAFGTGAGLRLMRQDSDMAEHVMLQLVRKGVVALPIHDSYIVADSTRNKGELMEAMAGALHKATSNKRGPSRTSKKTVPQYGGNPSTVACVYVFLPDLPQRDLFGADHMAVPASDVLAWRGGIAPPGVRQGLRHEAHRRGLRQREIAHLVGLSRPQLANLQSGRFGASPEAAARIRDFLIANAKTVGGPQ